MMKHRPLLVALAFAVLSSCGKSDNNGGTPPASQPTLYPVAAGVADEASGIADSKANSGALWVQQDSGNPPELILISQQGQLLKKIPFKGVTNRDWEDLAVAPGPETGKNYVYLAETGDNDAVYTDYAIYRFIEPTAATDSIRQVDAIRFRYADGAHDAEAILVDPSSLDIFIITKREARSLIYRIAYPYSTTAMNTATAAGQLPYNFVVSAALQPDGNGLVVKDYLNIYYYTRSAGETIPAVLAKTYTKLPYTLEQQGEAFCFSNDGRYYFTLSEKQSAPVSLIRYVK